MRTITLSLALGALAAASGCATPYGHGYDGADWSGPRSVYDGELHGPGVALLDRWLLETAEGRAVLTLGFSEAARGFVSEDVAHRANIWFRRYADENCDLTITDAEIRTALVTADNICASVAAQSGQRTSRFCQCSRSLATAVLLM